MCPVDIKRARYFLKLSETLNFSDAARALGISQPGLTKAIYQIEEDIGAKLIRREGRNTHLTFVGESMIEHFAKLVNVANTVDAAAKKIVSGDMPLIRIGLMCTIGPEPIAKFLSSFQKDFPDVEIILRTFVPANISEMLLAGDVDVVFIGAPIDRPDRFKQVKLITEKMVVASALDHKFAKMASVTLEEVTNEPYVDRLNCEFRDTFLHETAKRSFHPRFAIRTENESWAQVMIANGIGVSILPEFSIENSELAITPVSDVELQRTVSLLVCYGREDTKIVRSFLQAMEKYDWLCSCPRA